MKFRKNLLIDLLAIKSVSGNECLVAPMIMQEMEKLGFEVSQDKVGNVYGVRGKANAYPLLNAHMDIVDYDYGNWWKDTKKTTTIATADDDEADWLEEYNEIYSSMTDEEIGNYFECADCQRCERCSLKDTTKVPCDAFDLRWESYYKLDLVAEDWGLDVEEKPKTKSIYTVYESKGCLYGKGEDRVLGGDDKCGIFIALEVARLLRKTPMKLLFTVQEEIGCVGIGYAIKKDASWFDDIAYSITIDRRKGNHLLWSQMGKRSCTNEFAGRMAYAGICVGIPIEIQDGSVADVIDIREIVPNAVNISAGYHNPHDKDEYVVIDEVLRIIKWVRKFIETEKINENVEG